MSALSRYVEQCNTRIRQSQFCFPTHCSSAQHRIAVFVTARKLQHEADRLESDRGSNFHQFWRGLQKLCSDTEAAGAAVHFTRRG